MEINELINHHYPVPNTNFIKPLYLDKEPISIQSFKKPKVVQIKVVPRAYVRETRIGGSLVRLK